MKDDLIKQWQKDVEDYGGNAYLMWEWCSVKKMPHTTKEKWHKVDSIGLPGNIFINNSIDDLAFKYRRKQSAELPFDLERAKCGDEIQWKTHNRLFDVNFVNIWSEDGSSIYYNMATITYNTFYERACFCDLRMKYPPKV